MMMIMTLEVGMRQLLARTARIRRLVVVAMIASVPIERLDHVGQAIPVGLLLDNLPLI
jgi:hypothetical protein